MAGMLIDAYDAEDALSDARSDAVPVVPTLATPARSSATALASAALAIKRDQGVRLGRPSNLPLETSRASSQSVTPGRRCAPSRTV